MFWAPFGPCGDIDFHCAIRKIVMDNPRLSTGKILEKATGIAETIRAAEKEYGKRCSAAEETFRERWDKDNLLLGLNAERQKNSVERQKLSSGEESNKQREEYRREDEIIKDINLRKKKIVEEVCKKLKVMTYSVDY